MDSSGAATFKLGRHEPGLGVIEHRYGDVFERQTLGGEECLAIAPSEGQVELLIRLSRFLGGPFSITYVLLASFGGHAEGRYDFTERFDHESLEVFLNRFRKFFERDARHHLLVGGLGDNSRLVYDQHNFVCVVGPIEEVLAELESNGFRPGEVALPIPHSHHHHPEWDAVGEELLASYAWNFGSLTEAD